MTPTPDQNAKRVLLKPCPFCGHQQTDSDKHDHIVNHHDEGYAIHALACSKCGAVGPFGPEDDIEDAWNKRTPDPDELRQAADGMRDALVGCSKRLQQVLAEQEGFQPAFDTPPPAPLENVKAIAKALARYRALAGEGK